MANFVGFQAFLEHLAEKVHNLGSDTLKELLSNAAPSNSADAVRADLTSELGTAGGYTSGGGTPAISGSAQSAGLYKLVLADLVFTATGAGFGPFRYVVLYNDTPTSPADPLIGYWDYGSSISLADTETFTVDHDPTNGVLQMSFA
jgi:hypothetical protein